MTGYRWQFNLVVQLWYVKRSSTFYVAGERLFLGCIKKNTECGAAGGTQFFKRTARLPAWLNLPDGRSFSGFGSVECKDTYLEGGLGKIIKRQKH